MRLKTKEIADILHGTVEGNPDIVISTFARIESGKPGAICFFANPKYEKYVYDTKADAIIVNNDFKPAKEVPATMIRVENAYSAVAELLDYVTALKRSYRRHRGMLCRVKFSAKLGKKVYVGDFAYIGRKAKIGDYTKIYENVYVGDGVEIGDHCIIYPGVRIYPGMKIGNNVIIHSNAVIGADGFGFAPQENGTWKKIEHNGYVIIEDDVEIGANTCVDKSQIDTTIIRRGTKIDNLCQIGHNVDLGENCVMAGMSGIAGSAKIGKHCVIAGQAGISGHISLADNTTVGPHSGVSNTIKEPGQKLMGIPAIPYMDYMRSYSVFRKNGKK